MKAFLTEEFERDLKIHEKQSFSGCRKAQKPKVSGSAGNSVSVRTESFSCKIKDKSIQERIKKSIEKILLYHDVGKPLRYDLKGLRSARISPYRIVYEMHKKSERFFGMPKSGAFCA